MIKIHVLRCGIVGTDETVPDASRSKNPLAFTGVFRKDHRVWLPVFTYLIEHPDGRILVDTGWHTAVRDDQISHLTRHIHIASVAQLPKGEAVTEQLDRLHLKPQDIDIVVLTHLDVDHASGLKLVKDAKKFYAHPEEIKDANKNAIRYNRKMWDGIDLEGIPFTYDGIAPHEKSFDVFGDGTVRFIELSGHSKGTTGVLIQNEDRFVILTGDACYNRHNWEECQLQGITVSKENAMRSIQWVHDMSMMKGCVKILATHDPEIEEQVIEL